MHIYGGASGNNLAEGAYGEKKKMKKQEFRSLQPGLTIRDQHGSQ